MMSFEERYLNLNCEKNVSVNYINLDSDSLELELELVRVEVQSPCIQHTVIETVCVRNCARPWK